MPTVRETAQLCSHTMKTANPLPAGWQKITTSADHELEGGTLGYYGVAYVHEATAEDKRQEVVVVHRGTKLKRQEDKESVFKSSGDGVCNLANDGSIAFQSIPLDTKKALAFARIVAENYADKPDYRLLQLGHSLGGVHAHVCGYVLEQPVIVLDVPGIAEALRSYITANGLPEKLEQLNQHYAFQGQPNIVNNIHTQVGNVYQRVVNITDNEGQDLLKATPKEHHLSRLKEFMGDELPDPTLVGVYPYDGFVLLKKGDQLPELLPVAPLQPELPTYNAVGGRYIIDENQGALSLVRKFGAAHAFLLLEGMMHGKRHMLEIHLVIKEGTENKAVPKADIIFWAIDIDRLKKLAAGCYHTSWAVTPEQIRALEMIVVEEQGRANRGEIDYFLPGKAPAAGFFGASLQQSRSEALREWSTQHKKGSVSDYLLRSGHNCYSWAASVVRAVGLNPPTSFVETFIKDPRRTIVGDAEPTTKCLVM